MALLWLAIALAGLLFFPLVAGFVPGRAVAFRAVLLLGLAPALAYWVDVALVDPSYDLTRAGRLLYPGFYVLVMLALWCGLAYAGRLARRGFERSRKRAPTAA